MEKNGSIHIGFDAKRAFHNSSGLGNYSRDLIRILSEHHPQNRYTLFTPGKHRFAIEGKGSQQIVNPEGGFYNTFPSLWRTFGITNDLKKYQPDIYHGLSQELPLGISKLNIKTVVTIHDCIFLRYPELFDVSYRLIFKKKYTHAIKVADRIIAISQQTKRDIVKYFGSPEEKIDVVYQGCNPIFYQSVEKHLKEVISEKYGLPKKFILYVGTIEERKNLLSIFEGLLNAKTDLPVVVVGRTTKYIHKVKTFINSNGLNKRALFLHNVSTPDLPAIYQMAELFIYPSQFEGFGIPILEALNSGTPVITTNGSCFPEVGGDAAIYVDYKNQQQMTRSIDDILDNPVKRKELVIKGKKQALNFREDQIAESLLSSYNKVLNKHK